MEKNLKKNLFYYYLLLFLFETSRSCFFGIGSIFYNEQIKDFQLYHIYFIKLFAPMIIIILEIPTGILADKFSRKINFIISCLFCLFAFSNYYYATKISHCILSEILYSIGISFQSGSIDALIISQMYNSKRDLRDLLSKSSYIRSIALIFGGTIGIALSFKNIRFIWLFGVLGLIITIFFSTFLEEKKSIYNKEKKSKFNFEIFKNRSFIALILINVSLSVINAIFFNYWQQFIVKDLGISRRTLNYIYIYFFYNFFVSFGSFIVSKIKTKYNIILELFAPLYLIIVSTIVMSLTRNNFVALTFLMLSELARGILWPYFLRAYNNATPNEHRSLFLSLNSMTQRVTAILSLGLFSFVSYINKGQIEGRTVMLFSSLAAIFISFISLGFLNKDTNIKSY